MDTMQAQPLPPNAPPWFRAMAATLERVRDRPLAEALDAFAPDLDDAARLRALVAAVGRVGTSDGGDFRAEFTRAFLRAGWGERLPEDQREYWLAMVLVFYLERHIGPLPPEDSPPTALVA